MEKKVQTQEITYASLRIETSEIAGRLLAKAWSGKARKPYAYLSFRNEERRAQWIAEQKASEDARATYKLQRAEARAANVAKMREQITVGTILHYSWGWEQTNCEFYVVVERSAASLVMQQCGATRVGEGYSHGMAEDVKPDPSHVFGPRIRKVIGTHGVSMGHGSASPCELGSSHYSSWYA